MVLAGDESMREQLLPLVSEETLARIEAIRRTAAAHQTESLRYVISRQRLQAADALHDEVVSQSRASSGSGFARKLGILAVHPLLGAPILAAALYACYQFVGVLGAGTLVNLLENTVFYGHVVPWTEQAIRFLVPSQGLAEFLVGPAGVPFREHGSLIWGSTGSSRWASPTASQSCSPS